MRALFSLVLVMLAVQTPTPQAQVSKAFVENVKLYVGLRTKLEASLPKLKVTNDAAEIASHERALAAKLIESRSYAHQGDIFTQELTTQFREVFRKTFQQPGSQNVRRTIQEGDPPKPIVVKVNTIYPQESPVQTMPPTLLKQLPDLPMELAYRILGRSLVLLDNKTNVIVDFIPDAIP